MLKHHSSTSFGFPTKSFLGIGFAAFVKDQISSIFFFHIVKVARDRVYRDLVAHVLVVAIVVFLNGQTSSLISFLKQTHLKELSLSITSE